MKTQKSFNQLDLRVAALEYLFVEWLVRNRLYRRYAKNLAASGRVTTSVRDNIRDRLYRYSKHGFLNYSFFLAGSFAFTETPEGREFWVDASNRWEEFCKSFFSLF